MPASAKPMSVHFALSLCVLASLVMGLAWLDAGNERNRAARLNRELTSEIAALKNALAAEQHENDEYRAAIENKIRALEQRIADLNGINDKVKAELDEKALNGGFEVPDGIIRWVDRTGSKVWIDLGQADGLKARTTFNVYKKIPSRFGREKAPIAVSGEEIKGTIEVTRVLEAHLSEARILTEDIRNRIAKGDPVFSLNWRPARGEVFSFIGIMDLDGDGTDDRDVLKEAVATAGGAIDNDVDGNGELFVNGKRSDDGIPYITERTKFVVMGRMPEIGDMADINEAAAVAKISLLRKSLEIAARQRGVRIVSLSDFLKYLGYKSQRRVSLPGGESSYKLKSGSTSSGSTRGAYSGDKSRQPKKASRAGVAGMVFSGSM